MFQTWQLQEAKNKLSRVVKEAVNSGPQIITKHGVEVAVVLSYDAFRKQQAAGTKLSTFFQESPLVEVEFDLERDRSAPRESLEL